MIQYTRPPYPRIDDLIKEAQKLMYDAGLLPIDVKNTD